MTTDPKLAALEAELAKTRAELAATVDELATRLDPRTQATHAVDSAKKLARDAVGSGPEADPEEKTHARIVLGTAAGVLATVIAGAARRR
ncbi:DUF3618 domain-containing protein [Cellulomonas sp. P24]|uniref:DUF3618 domain-containing protein n=1 Tax=Cellulomonas sp. P24 TaxID=2885206 RepID=UPI00216AD687|nr:DUF3618 domain-containing protein [Cellulomonas sp. P24]MCR6493114.1 DUF3618 domain-containing protein [Cellulomonas sp. P24]